MDAVTKSSEVHRFELSQFSSASYIGLVLLNVLLNIVTLTLYRFWGKTAIRRRLWAETSLGGESFEYSGRGMELFIGFLIATFTVFLPIVLIFSAAQIFLDPVALILVILPMYVVIFVLAFPRFFWRAAISSAARNGAASGSAWTVHPGAMGSSASAKCC